MKHLSIVLAAATAMLLPSCSTKSGDGTAPTSSTAAAPASPAPGATIRQDKDGRTQVDGAPLHGDPKVCAAFKKCCAAPPTGDFGLMCGMAQAEANGDCAKALTTVKAYARERRLAVCK